MHHGIAVSPGVVVAPAFCLDEVVSDSTANDQMPVTDVSLELGRFDHACEDAARELRELIEKVTAEIGDREAGIFQAHLLMLRDRAFVGKVKGLIANRHCPAHKALAETTAEYETLFASIADEYLRERIVDLRDVAARIRKHLDRTPHLVAASLPVDEPVIVVARELFPSQAMDFGEMRLAGILTEHGGGTSHAAIIARSLGIPAVSGIHDLLSLVHTGDIVALDGRDGHVIINPGPEAAAAYRKLEREFFDLKGHHIHNRDQPSVTRDGHAIELLANINNLTDARAATEVGAAGVGLFRTEYLFMLHPSIPSEDEQHRSYCAARDGSPNRLLTVRTLDLGGDKTVPYLGEHREGNPMMGWRSLRLSMAHPEFFLKQLRAILRAGAEGDVRLMFPMVTTVAELRRANRLVLLAERQLAEAGAPFGKKLPRGIMVEVPAAAISIEHLLDYVDFVSIGSNDLAQYLTAADRDNAKVADLCDPLNPAVLRVLHNVIAACDRAKVPVTVCGEMAGRPSGVLALLALGLRRFSLSPAFVPIIKELVHSVNLADLAGVGEIILRKRSASLVRKYLSDLLERVDPRLAMMEWDKGLRKK